MTWEQVPPRNWAEGQAHRIAQEVRRLRGKRGVQWLADETVRLGHAMSRVVLTDIEIGRRRYITTAELCILAAALETAPLALVYPGPYEEIVQVVPNVQAMQGYAALWFRSDLKKELVSSLFEVPPGTPEFPTEDYFENTSRLVNGLSLIRQEQRLRAQLNTLRIFLERKKHPERTRLDKNIDAQVVTIFLNPACINAIALSGESDYKEALLNYLSSFVATSSPVYQELMQKLYDSNFIADEDLEDSVRLLTQADSWGHGG